MAVGRDGYLYSWGSGANNTTGVGSTANSLTAKYTKRGESFYSDDGNRQNRLDYFRNNR